MKDIPFFTTQSGVASLILRQIPYTSEAYVRIHQTEEPASLLDECCNFCRFAGAEKVYATGDNYLEEYPLHTSLLLLSCSRINLVSTDAHLVPVTEENSERWQQIYNERMKNVHSAATMTNSDMKKLCVTGGAYFIYKADSLIGIGAVEEDKILAIASVKPGSGADIIRALNGTLKGDRAYIEVSSDNERAVRLYENLGFRIINEITRWYRIL